MNIAIFQDITTEQALTQLEADGVKYEGLFVDMDNKDERKYVKDNAALIIGLLKKLDRARIDKIREYKNQVESEAADIQHRLEVANNPFTLLLDEHKAKRAKILADKKAIEDAKALAIQIEQDHEQAIMEDKVATFERVERDRQQREHIEAEAGKAREQAILDERDRVSLMNQAAEAAKALREQDKEHKKAINSLASSGDFLYSASKDCIMKCNMKNPIASSETVCKNQAIKSLVINPVLNTDGNFLYVVNEKAICFPLCFVYRLVGGLVIKYFISPHVSSRTNIHQ